MKCNIINDTPSFKPGVCIYNTCPYNQIQGAKDSDFQ